METLDATSFGQALLRLGLITEPQLIDCKEELGDSKNDMQALLRVLERRSLLTPWQTDRVLKGYTDGFFLGGYRILYKVASGSFGRVFRADDPRSGRVVAVKVLRRRWSEDPKQIEAFMREGRLGMTLRHANIVEVLAIAQDASSGQYYIAMEFVEGANLREVLAIRKTLSISESLKIIDDAASGLAHAHSKGMTHRDIKLTNLLISATGDCKLVDFGLAQFYADKARGDRTVDYAGLERATGVKPGDTRSDIYFLGCILYECLTGRSPLVMTRDRQARMRKERFQNVPAIRPDELDAPASVFGLVETMMSLVPARRYQTPTQLLEAIRAARRDVEGTGKKSDGKPATRSVFIAERSERLQEALRDAFKSLGYRVFMASDPVRAVDRFRQQPFDALVVDAKTTGEEGIVAFENVRFEADRRRSRLAAVVLLGEDQEGWADRVRSNPGSAVLVHPVTFKQLQRTLEKLLA